MKCHALHGRVSWNCNVFHSHITEISHALHGRVSWNIRHVHIHIILVMSRPTRACELKFRLPPVMSGMKQSRPTRACELKFLSSGVQFVRHGHALHGRVSWNQIHSGHLCVSLVTPYTGVWVEIFCQTITAPMCGVTPYTGVWVEIHQWRNGYWHGLSRPTRACELKLNSM